MQLFVQYHINDAKTETKFSSVLGAVNKRRHGHVLEDSEMSEQETSQDPSYVPPKRSNRDPRMFRAGRAAVAPQSPSKVSPKTGRMMEMHTGKVLQAEGSKAPAAADKVAEAQADKQTLQREKRSPPPKRGPGRPPNPKLGAPGTWCCVPHLFHVTEHCHCLVLLHMSCSCVATACKQSCVT